MRIAASLIYLANDLGIIINFGSNLEFNDAVAAVFYIKHLELFREFINTNAKIRGAHCINLQACYEDVIKAHATYDIKVIR